VSPEELKLALYVLMPLNIKKNSHFLCYYCCNNRDISVICHLNSSISPFVNVLKLLCLLTAVLGLRLMVPNTCKQRN